MARRAISSGHLFARCGAVRKLLLQRRALVDQTETQLHGLALTGGVISSTGIAALTLGGGLGWLMGKYGHTEVPTAAANSPEQTGIRNLEIAKLADGIVPDIGPP